MLIMMIVILQLVIDMSQSNTLENVGKVLTVAGVTLLVNHLIKQLNRKREVQPKTISRQDNILNNYCSQGLITFKKQINDEWGVLAELEGEEDLLKQLKMMNEVMCPFVKVNHLIVDLNLPQIKTFPCSLIARTPKRYRHQPSLLKQALVKPGQFLIENCCFKIGQQISCEKKFLRAGPRETQYFYPQDVRADIVVCGKVVPGVNSIIRELTILLKETYNVKSVTGVRYSFKGYYQKIFLDLNQKAVETIHHKGGCFLGVCQAECHASKIVDNLIERKINQLYIIGGNNALEYTYQIYEEIKKRRLSIAIGIAIKAINKNTPYFQTCFGFQTAVEEAAKFIEMGYALCKSNFYSVSLIKVPGSYSGFLAVDASQSSRNVAACLVPQFKFQLYGDNGLLQYIVEQIKNKGYCVIVYSQGARSSILDQNQQSPFDQVFCAAIETSLKQNNLGALFFLDCREGVRAVPANSLDTKLCSQIALSIIQSLMCGYTGFAIGHLKSRTAMIPLSKMINSKMYCLTSLDPNWQRLLTYTDQPLFLNNQ